MKEIGRCYKYIVKAIDGLNTQMMEQMITPEKLTNRFCGNLGLANLEFLKLATAVIATFRSLRITEGHTSEKQPASVAAAAIYLCVQIWRGEAAAGIDVNRVVMVVWIVGAALAAMGGILFGSAVAVDWFMGFRLLLLMFAAVILGGLGTAYGAMVGAIVIGLVTELSVLWFPAELKFMWALVVLIVVLLVRPQGILGRAERIG